jgi:hypothetical protein
MNGKTADLVCRDVHGDERELAEEAELVVELELRAVRLARVRHRRPTRRPKVSGPRAAPQHALRTQRAPRQQRRPVDGVQVRHVGAIFRNFLRVYFLKQIVIFCLVGVPGCGR